jgi:hypothetical protein
MHTYIYIDRKKVNTENIERCKVESERKFFLILLFKVVIYFEHRKNN